MNRLKGNKKGFTLVELIVMLVILAILIALLVPTLTGYIDRANILRVPDGAMNKAPPQIQYLYISPDSLIIIYQYKPKNYTYQRLDNTVTFE